MSPVRAARVRWCVPIAAVVLLAACDGAATAPEPPAEEAPEAATTDEVELLVDGVLTVCLDAPVEPFVVRDADDDLGVGGFEVAVLRELADRLDLQLEVERARVERIQSGAVLGDERCDLGGSGLAITERRAEQVDFTRPYFQTRQALLLADERPDELEELAAADHLDDLEDLADLDGLDGLRVGVRADSPGEEVAERYVDGAEVVPFEEVGDLLPALLLGDVDVVLRDLVAGAPAIEAVDGVTVAFTVPAGHAYAFALRAGRTDGLAAAIDAELAAMDDDGTRDRLVAEAFGLE